MNTLQLLRGVLGGQGADEGSSSDPRTMTATLLASGALGAMLFGAVTGGAHGGMQIISSALKLPLMLILPLVICLPALHWSYSWSGTPVAWPALVRQGALAICRMGLGLLIGMPVLWVIWRLSPPHAVGVQIVACILGMVFLISVRPLFQLGSSAHRLIVIVLLALTLGQSAWVLRPFIGDGERFRWFEDPSGDFVSGLVDPMYRVAPGQQP